MFNWTAIPDSLDNNYEESESTSPSISSSSATFALQNTHAQMLTRSASTSHLSSGSTHLDPMSHTVTSSSRPHQRTPGAGSLSEFSSPVMSSSTRLLSTKNAGDQTNGGLRAPPNSAFDTLTGAAGALGGASQSSLLDPLASNPCWWYPRKSASLPDFVLISEFSEVEGPRAVMTIPDNIVDLTRDSYSSNKQRQEASPGKSHPQHMQDLSDTTLSPENSSAQEREDMFDIHEFVLRITSVDQQAQEASGSFHIPEDIEVHISDSDKGYWAYVHHFTLFDINARGFVRPFCMSYITRDPHKILAHYEEMRHKFSKAALHFKTGNYMLFRQDLTKKLRDLNFTNNLLSEAPSEPKSSDPSSSTTPTPIPSASPSISNLQSESVTTPPSSSTSSPPTGTPSREQAMSSTTSHDTITASPSIDHLEGPSGTMTEAQKEDLESIKDAIETATHIISTLEHYSVDGQPLLGHADDGNEGAHSTVPLSDLSPMTSSENLASLAAGRTGPTDPSLFLGATSRPGARIRHKGSTSNVSGAMTSRVYDTLSPPGHMEGLSAALPPHLLGLQEQSRKNSVVSEYDSMMYEAPEYEAQYVTTLYPIFRDEVTFRPLRELCIATMVWNSSIQFHLGVKKIKDILRDFQADSQLLGEASDSIKRMYPTSSSLTVGQRFMMNFRNPNFNRTSTRQTHYQPTSVPFMEILEGISLANAPPSDDGLSVMSKAVDTTPGAQEQEVELMVETAETTRMQGPTLDADDADDEETGYDSLDDAASFFTAATGVATHADTPTREAFLISPLDRSSRVAEWHQEQQTIHRAKGGTPQEGSQGHGPWAFGAGVAMAEAVHGPSRFNRAHRHSAQSGTSIGITGAPSLQSTNCPTIILDTLQRDPSLAKHLAFALLSGQRLCVMGQSESEAKVRTLVSVLSTFLPHAGFPSKEEQLIEHQHQFITWFQGPGLLRLEDMDTLHLVGVDSGKIEPKFLESDICILDYDTLTWVHGQQYSDGIMLESIFCNMSLFSDDISFLAFVDGKLFEILLKSFLYYHLVFHGRLYQGGSLLALPGAQSFYSSGASDDGEAFSYQSNFRSSKQSPMLPKSSGLSRSHRKNTSTYPSSTQLGATASYKNTNSRTFSLSSYESSDTEKLPPRSQDHRNGAHDYGDDSRYPQYEHREGMDLEEEASQSGGPMQYTTSQGMHKWKKWFEYWSAKSAAMIDPALAAFGRSESTAQLDNSGSNRRKWNTSGRASPGFASPQQHLQPQQPNRRSRISSSHTSPGRSREAKEREKERDRERDRERSRKSTFDPFDVVAKEKASYSDYDSDLRGDNEKDAEKEAMASPVQSEDPQQVKIEESHDSLVQALTPLSSPRFKDSSAVAGLKKLKPKRPLTLHRPLSKSSDREQDKSDAESASGDRKLQRSLSSGSTSGLSPPPSASFRSFTGALRAMSFGQSSTYKDNAHGTRSRDDSPTNASSGLSAEPSPRHSHELSDSNSKDIKRRGSARTKAKAWFKGKKKRRSRIDGGELEQGATIGGSRQSSEVLHKDDLSEEEEVVGSFAGQSHGSDTDDQEYRPRQLHGDRSLKAKEPLQSSQEISSTEPNKEQDPVSQAKDDLTTDQVVSSATPEELSLTIEEIAAQEPTRIQSRPPPSSSHSPPPMATAFGHNNSSSNNSSQISSANTSRITSPTLPASFTASQRLLHSQQQGGPGSQRTLDSASSSSVITVARSNVHSRASMRGGNETRSEHDDSEYDRRESATEYETSQETFPMTDGNGSPALESLPHPQALLPPTSQQQQQQQQQQQHAVHHPPPSRILTTGSTASRVALPMDAKRRMSLEPPGGQGGVNSLGKERSLHSRLTVDTAAVVAGASVVAGEDGAQSKESETVTLTEEEEAVVREMIGGVTGADDWNIIVYLATMVDVYERSKDPVASGSSEP